MHMGRNYMYVMKKGKKGSIICMSEISYAVTTLFVVVSFS